MYKSYFGISSNPFSIAPDPHFLYMSDGHREALAHLRYGLGEGGGFVLLTGEVGTGKTTMCRCLLEQVPDDTNIALVINPKLSSRELLATICDELGITYPEHIGLKGLIDGLNKYLLAAHSRGQRTVLIIDEAQNLSYEVLEQVRLLTNLETDQQRLLQIVLLGQPELQEMLAQPELRQLSQRIAARYHLVPLTQAETIAYVRHRLAVVGMDPAVFSLAAVKEVFRASSGTPRMINLICDRALLGAYGKGGKLVDLALVKEAARQILGPKIRPRLTLIPTWVVLWAMTVVVLIVVAALQWPREDTAELSSLPVQMKPMSFGDTARQIPGADDKTMPVPPSASQPPPKAQPVVAPQLVAANTDWPTPEQTINSQATAYSTLLSLWGVTANASVALTCQGIQTYGLRCLTPRGGLEDLLRLNTPAILSMTSGGERFFMVLARVKGNSVTLRLGSMEVRSSVEEMVSRWDGSSVLFWRPPPGFSSDISPGANSPVIGWLAEQLALVDGKEYNADSEHVYDQPLVERVKRIQLANNLKPDGIVGGEVLIIVADLAGIKKPLLRETSG